MKKTIIIVLFLLITISLSACSLSKDSDLELNNDTLQADFKQPEDSPDLRGLVKSIKGNEVEILKLSLDYNNRDKKNNENEIDEGEKEVFSLNSDNISGRGGMPGRGGGPREENNEGGRSSMIEMLKEQSEGEETVVIPVGIQMLKSSNDSSNKNSMIEASLEDVTTEKMITIWLNSDITNRNVAEFVLIN